jgi:hypothetical protein
MALTGESWVTTVTIESRVAGAGRGSRTPKTRRSADFEADGSEPEDDVAE